MKEHADPQSFDRFAVDYDVLAAIGGRHRFFLDRLPRGREGALEIGCGTGRLAWQLSLHFRSVVAVDSSEPMLAIARRDRPAPGIRYVHADIDKLTLTGHYDLVCSHTTFHHLPDVAATLRRLVDVLRPGGRLVVVDCVQRWPRGPRFLLRLAAVAHVPLDVARHGWRQARRIHRSSVAPAWLDHLASDRYLSPGQFRATYGKGLPGASFERVGGFYAVVWDKPQAQAVRNR